MSSKSKRSDWRKDKLNIALLLFLYLLQGIPLGMAASIPLIIQTYGATYSQQATFSFAFWPFSLKLLWAPIVDSMYFKRFGRRKSWLIPIQYLIGLAMIILSFHINDILLTTAAATDTQPRIYFIHSNFSLKTLCFVSFRYLFSDSNFLLFLIPCSYTRYLCRWLGIVNAFKVNHLYPQHSNQSLF
jgi:PAT family acetyl-CoA transporter-like MFS transporter 1